MFENTIWCNCMVKVRNPYKKPKLTTHGKLKHITKNVENVGAEDGTFGCSAPHCPPKN